MNWRLAVKVLLAPPCTKHGAALEPETWVCPVCEAEARESDYRQHLAYFARREAKGRASLQGHR